MTKTNTCIWIHAVFATYRRRPWLAELERDPLNERIRKNLDELQVVYRIVNHYHDHVHLLFQLPSFITLAEILKQIKGETSAWINRQGIFEERFRWQRGYSAFSVNPAEVHQVERYIERQPKVHQYDTYKQELQNFNQKISSAKIN
jgi:REP element-mobilizing transposase RayT